MLKTGMEIANAFDSARDEYCDAHLNGWPQRWAVFVSMPISRFHDPDVSNQRPLVRCPKVSRLAQVSRCRRILGSLYGLQCLFGLLP